MILQDITEHKRWEVAQRERRVPLEDVRRSAAAAASPREVQFEPGMSLIAEVKRRSPSKGALTSALDPVAQARAYEQGGAAAISVLTDERFFGGSFEDLFRIRAAVQIPVLCKDFLLTSYQIYEARSHGADLVLLIVAALDDGALADLQGLALELGMVPLIEVHDQHDLARALAAGTPVPERPFVLGVNNRDLKDFSVDLLTTEYLAPLVPDGAVVVSESGIRSREDVGRVRMAGARAVLGGEALMRAGDPASAIRELLS